MYTIVLYESSPEAMKKFPDDTSTISDKPPTRGLELELLERYTFISLDNFRHIVQNRGMRDKLETWLAFLCIDDPEWIIKIAGASPEFQEMYREVYEMCRNLEEVMSMYSKELQELDEGTVQYMMDELQEQADELKKQDDKLREQVGELEEMWSRLQELEAQLKR